MLVDEFELVPDLGDNRRIEDSQERIPRVLAKLPSGRRRCGVLCDRRICYLIECE